MQAKVDESSTFKLFVEVGRQIRSKPQHQAGVLHKVVATIGENLGLDRCVVMLFDDKLHELTISGEYCRIPCKPMEQTRYQVRSGSECYELLLSGKPLPLSVIAGEGRQAKDSPEIEHFAQLSESKSLVAFPLIADGHLIGVLFMHYCQEFLSFPESYLELGESIATELALFVRQERTAGVKNEAGQLFNIANCTLSSTMNEFDNEKAWVDDNLGKHEETIATLTKQLNRERIVRHVISMLYSSLDRDTILQTTADSLGRVLGASRCLVVRIDDLAPPMVTHEYVQADISPLGLGRTSQFPQEVISLFRQRSTMVDDVFDKQNLRRFSEQDLGYLNNNNIRALLGTPVYQHNLLHGVVLAIQNDRPRLWTAQEVELMEAIAGEVAVALNHAQSYSQIKDQLFNMNLLGNLTQQLTNVLDLASRQANAAQDEGRTQSHQVSPLSLRELEVLKLIASGLANREIAQKLFLTESTVELHASRIRKKLKLKSRTALVKYACDNRLV